MEFHVHAQSRILLYNTTSLPHIWSMYILDPLNLLKIRCVSVMMGWSGARPSYQRLKQETVLDHEGARKRSWKKCRMRRKVRVKMVRCKNLVGMKIEWRKIWVRLKESRTHFGYLFAGNYLFTQINPTPLINHRTTPLVAYS